MYLLFNSRSHLKKVLDLLNVAFNESGDIKITGRQIDIINSILLAGILIGDDNAQAGDIEIKASDILNIRDISGINNDVFANARGNSGNIKLSANSFLLNSSLITTTTNGQGNSGKINIDAKEQVSIENGFVNSNIGSAASGDSGGIKISTNKLSVKNNAQIQSDTAGKGNSGGINIFANDSVLLDGITSNSVSRIRSDIAPRAIGDSDGIFINTASLVLSNASKLSSSVWGNGKSNGVRIQARENVLLNQGEIFTTLEETGEGSAGNIFLESSSILLNNGSRISSQTNGQGNAGNVAITGVDKIEIDQGSLVSSRVANSGNGKGGNVRLEAKSVIVANDSQIAANTFGNGDAGNIFVTAQDKVDIDGGGLFSNTGAWPNNINLNQVNGGSINVTTGSLSVTKGGQLVAVNAGRGKAGNINIVARDDVRFDGISDTGDTSLASSIVELRAEGDSGDINITARSLYVTNGAQLTSDTRGKGDGGDIIINAEKDVVFDGNSIFNLSLFGNQFTRSRPSLALTGTIGFGIGGDIIINSENLKISNSAGLSSGEFSNQAGNITVNAKSINLQDGNIKTDLTLNGDGGNINLSSDNISLKGNSNINTTTGLGKGGNVNLEAKNILLRNDSNIRTNSGGGDGGNIFLNANTIISLEDSDILAFAPKGQGGNITFDTAGFFSTPLYTPSSQIADEENLNSLDINQQVDVNASGAIDGDISGVPNITFIENSLTDLQQNPIDTNALIANSCIARSRKQESTFNITGSGGLPQRPGDAAASSYPTGEVQNLADKIQSSQVHSEEAIIEPQGVYELPSGKLILSRECS